MPSKKIEINEDKNCELKAANSLQYAFPPTDLLDKPKKPINTESEDYATTLAKIVQKFADLGISVEGVKVSPGAMVSRYEIRLPSNVKLSKIAMLEDDIAFALHCKQIRNFVPIANSDCIGIEVPNKYKKMIGLWDIIETREWKENKDSIPVIIGEGFNKKPVIFDLKKSPHLLIGSLVGQGGSTCIVTIVASLLLKMSPEDLRLIVLDSDYLFGLRHNPPHMLAPVISDVHKFPVVLKWLISEMDFRYKIFRAANVRDINSYNAKILQDRQTQVVQKNDDTQSQENSSAKFNDKKFPHIVCVIDELSSLMMSENEIEDCIAQLAQRAGDAGIHLIVASKEVSLNIISGVIKSNFSTRIAFRVRSQIESRTILDCKGAEKLIGFCDMLYLDGDFSDVTRALGVYTPEDEFDRIVEFLSANTETNYNKDLLALLD